MKYYLIGFGIFALSIPLVAVCISLLKSQILGHYVICVAFGVWIYFTNKTRKYYLKHPEKLEESTPDYFKPETRYKGFIAVILMQIFIIFINFVIATDLLMDKL